MTGGLTPREGIMLKTCLLHPEILEALASSGHGSRVLIADANYPFSTTEGPNSRIVFLNLTPGKLTAPEVLAVLNDVIPIEEAVVMAPDHGVTPPVFREFQEILGSHLEIKPTGRFKFYETVRSSDCALTIATGDTRLYANILLTIGVVEPK